MDYALQIIAGISEEEIRDENIREPLGIYFESLRNFYSTGILDIDQNIKNE